MVDELLERHGGDVRRCFDELSGFGTLRRELELEHKQNRKSKSNGNSDPNSSTHPTVASIPIKPEHQADESLPVSSPDAADDGDSFLPGEAGVPPEPEEHEWFLGTPSGTGLRFQVLRPHAQGGIGKVSVAFDAELQREVALKQIKPERADDVDSRARFMLEAEVTGRLEHPGIVPVYGLGADDHGRPFYAMRFVRGTSFDEAIKQFHQADTTLSPRRPGALDGAAAVARPVCRRLPHGRLRPQPRRAPSRLEAGQRAARSVQRVAGRGLGPRQSVRPWSSRDCAGAGDRDGNATRAG